MKSVKVNSGKEVKYDGQIEEGEPNGIRTITYHDGTNYVGEWRDGEENGQETFTFSDGGKYDREFKDGDKWNGRVYDNSRINKSKYVDGVKQ